MARDISSKRDIQTNLLANLLQISIDTMSRILVLMPLVHTIVSNNR